MARRWPEGKRRDVTQSGPQIFGGVREGDLLAGKYRIEKILGAGGMGIVVAAQHVQLDEKVAIKFLLPEALSNAEAVARFAREARAAVKIKSEHVARVIDVGTLDTGAAYMVMEYLEGGDLSAWLKQRGPLPIEQAVEFILQACEAIADAHGLGIVHRDLKPSNLFCIRRSDGVLSIKVLDFGISKVATMGPTGPEMSMTKTTVIMGSPLYMSPEQMQSSRNVDARTDIWSVGVILYELLTGKVPFEGDTLSEVCVKAAMQPPPPIRDRRPDVPLALEVVILKCLEKSRENRYRNVAELALGLAPFGPKRSRASVERISGIIQAAGLSMSALALPPSSRAEPDSGPQDGTQAAWGQTKSGNKWGRSGATVVVALFAVAVVGALIWFLGGRGRGSRATAAAPGPSSTESALPTPAVSSAAPHAASRPVVSQSASAKAEPSPIELPKPSVPSDGKTSAKSSKSHGPAGNAGLAPATHPSTTKKRGDESPPEPATQASPSSTLGGRI